MARHIVAVVQMHSTADKASNLRQATSLVEEAVNQGAEFVALPELFLCLSSGETMVAQAEPVPGPATDALAQIARRLGITLLGGSLPEQSGDAQRVFNTSVLFGPDGTMLSVYRKTHLFGIDVPGQVTFDESRFMRAGNELVVVETPVGRLGHSTCFDLRFPELYRRLTFEGNAHILAVPSAFTMETGRDHWETLLRARAVENQVYVIAPNQCGKHAPGLRTYGRSMIVDPWGIPLAIAPDGPSIAVAVIDSSRLEQVRKRIPAHSLRRDVYAMPLINRPVN